MACVDCPDYIKATVAKPVEKALGQVRSVKKVTESFNAIVADFTDSLVQEIVSDLTAVVNAIPDPPTLALGDVVSLITCPLLPIAIGLDPSLLSGMDPLSIINRIKATLKDYIEDITRDYEKALKVLSSWQNINIGKRFFEDLKRVNLSVVVLAEASLLSAFVKSVCSDIYTGSVYEDFDNEMSDFSVTGILPVNLSETFQPVMTKLQEAEVKLGAWRLLAVV